MMEAMGKNARTLLASGPEEPPDALSGASDSMCFPRRDLLNSFRRDGRSPGGPTALPALEESPMPDLVVGRSAA